MSKTITRDYKFIPTHSFNFLQSYVLKKSHPTAIIFEFIGLIWVSYYIWHHLWPWALIALTLAKLLSYLSVVDVDVNNISQTMLGKIALLHLHPMNLTVQVTGIILYYYGLWSHSLETLISGVTLLLLGHLVGWGKINENFSKKI